MKTVNIGEFNVAEEVKIAEFYLAKSIGIAR
jgi:hypothetical protein